MMDDREHYDVVVVGGGHNGLTCAAYLARGGLQVAVLEARNRLGGSCAVDLTRWSGYRVPPCAAVLGLLHPRVIDELGLLARGLRVVKADGGMLVPFADGESLLLADDHALAATEVGRVAPGDLRGWLAMTDLVSRTAALLRPTDDSDLWLDPEPSLACVEARLAGGPSGDDLPRQLALEWSMVELLDRYLANEQLRQAYLGQGVIAADASPLDHGTAAIYLHHYSGWLSAADGAGELSRGSWGYVAGGIGRVSDLLAEAAREAGATLLTATPVERIHPGVGVELAGGRLITAPTVVSNADPLTTCRMLGSDVDPAWAERVEALPCRGLVGKVNMILNELPRYRSAVARPASLLARNPRLGDRAVLDLPLALGDYVDGLAAARSGRVPDRLLIELYQPSVGDPTLAPAGKYLCSGWVQYLPATLSTRDDPAAREQLERTLIGQLAEVTTNLPAAIEGLELLGPRDLERDNGTTTGHPFHVDCTASALWHRRLTPRTPHRGVYLCGAGIHPGGGVTAVNGRNAAAVVLGDLRSRRHS